MNRKVLLTTIFPVTFFLLFLGMRIPDLTRNVPPKPKPRAVVENVEKESKEISSSQQQDVDQCKPFRIVSGMSDPGYLTHSGYEAPFKVVKESASRAPPLSPSHVS